MNKELKEAVKVLKNVDTNMSGNIICTECIYPKNATCIVNNKDCQINAIETILNYIENSISKEKIEKLIEKINRYENTAKEQIEERIVIADSDSLNLGRRQAHGKDIEELKELLEGK